MAQHHPVLVRTGYAARWTTGLLDLGPDLRLPTLERPWIPNPSGPGGVPRESCVPDGEYALRPHRSAKYPDGVWALVSNGLGVYYQPGDIPAGQPFGRSAVLWHPANRVQELLGCVAIGLELVWLENEPQVLRSREAFARVREVLGDTETHVVTIRPTAGTREPVR